MRKTAHRIVGAIGLSLAARAGLAQTALPAGVTLSGRYLGEFAANLVGGQRQGADFAGELAVGAKFDMRKLAGIRGATVKILFTDRQGNSLAAQTINNSVSIQQIYGGGQTYQLTELTYRQALRLRFGEERPGALPLDPAKGGAFGIH